MPNLAEELLLRFKEIRSNGKPENLDAGSIIADLVTLLEKYVSDNEKHLYEEMKAISDKIQHVKRDLSEKLPNGATPEASQELDAVVQATEEATNNILDAAEKIMALTTNIKSEEAKNINSEIVKIFEACNFQDITGQRIKKVISTLQYIDKSISHLLSSQITSSNHKPTKKKTLAEMTDKDLMNGPQLKANAPNQDDVDQLFNNA